MKRTHEASAYKTWLAAEVRAAIGDRRPSVPHDQVAADWAIERAALLERVRA